MKFKKIDKTKLKTYFRQLGLSCVIATFSAAFIEANTNLLSLGVLFIIGSVFSYFGLGDEA